MKTDNVNETTELLELICDLKQDLAESRKARRGRQSKLRMSRTNRLMRAEVKSRRMQEMFVQRRYSEESKEEQRIATTTHRAEMLHSNTVGEGESSLKAIEMLDDQGESLLQQIDSSASRFPRLAKVASMSRSRVRPLVDNAEAAVEEEKNSEGIRI